MKNTNIKGGIVVFSVFFASFSLTLGLSFFAFKSLVPTKVKAATLTNASATLSNPRLSYRALTTAGTSGTSSITISSSTSYPDYNTNHLFPGDTVCFTNGGPTGCLGSVNYTVATVSGAQTFSISSPLTTGVDTAGYAIATQSGNLTLTFTLASTIPSGGSIRIGLPLATTGNVNDGFPDTGTSNTTNGFDLNKLTGTSVNVSSTGGTCTDGWNTPAISTASGTITITKATSSCAGATMTIVIPNLVNPTPFITNHTQGTPDVYKIAVDTRDGGGAILDTTKVTVAPLEGVFISATIDQTLSFTISGITADSGSYCGVTRTGASVDSTPWSIPWGTIASFDTFLDAQQMLQVSTNASGGYTVVIEANDQMGRDGKVCTGTSAGEADLCIKDTACDSGPCDYQTAQNWATATNNGLGYTMASVSGTVVPFYYNEKTRTYSAKQLPDQEASEAKQIIMQSSAPVAASSSQAYVCYRISVSGTQPAGYYYNKVKYTATARF